jgi:hypothetical protein
VVRADSRMGRMADVDGLKKRRLCVATMSRMAGER